MVKELRQRQRVKQIVYSWPSLIVLVAISFFLIKGAVSLMLIERQSAKRVQELETQSQALTLRENELQEGIQHLQTEEGIVDEIRGKFSVAREGEYMAIIVDEKAKATSTEDEGGLKWFKNLWKSTKNLWSKEP